MKRKNSETHQEEPPPLDNWYYAKDQEVVGPLLESEMLSLMKTEEITKETLVFNAALGDEWRVLEDTHFIKKIIIGAISDTSSCLFIEMKVNNCRNLDGAIK